MHILEFRAQKWFGSKDGGRLGTPNSCIRSAFGFIYLQITSQEMSIHCSCHSIMTPIIRVSFDVPRILGHNEHATGNLTWIAAFTFPVALLRKLSHP